MLDAQPILRRHCARALWDNRGDRVRPVPGGMLDRRPATEREVIASIEIEDGDVQTIMERYRLRTKIEAVDLALPHLPGQPMTGEEAPAMRGACATHKSSRLTPPAPELMTPADTSVWPGDRHTSPRSR